MEGKEYHEISWSEFDSHGAPSFQKKILKALDRGKKLRLLVRKKNTITNYVKV